MNWHDLFIYEPETGKLFWRVTRSNRAVAGTEAGTSDKDGYVNINTHGKVRKAHRIIWDMLHPEDTVKPDEQIDHINHVRNDNRPGNLRKVTSRGNRMNASLGERNTSSFVGVGWRSDRNCWRASITINRKQIALGCFDSFEEAVSARKAAQIKYGFHENHGAKNEAKK